MKILKQKKGITLVALVVTIIILIILAGISVSLLLGNNGIINKAKEGRNNYAIATNEEYIQMTNVEYETADANVGSSSREDTIILTSEQYNSITTTLNNLSNKIEKLENSVLNEIGTIVAYSFDSIPEEYLECNGQAISRADYADLFSKIGTKYGSGDGNTTFNIPDLRGEFLRGAGTNSHTNQGSGSNIGAHQDATAINHGLIDHTIGFGTGTILINGDGVNGWATPWKYMTNNAGSNTAKASYSNVRPTNTSVLYCIKVK